MEVQISIPGDDRAAEMIVDAGLDRMERRSDGIVCAILVKRLINAKAVACNEGCAGD